MGTCGLVAMTSAPHAEGRQFDPGQVYFSFYCRSIMAFAIKTHEVPTSIPGAPPQTNGRHPAAGWLRALSSPPAAATASGSSPRGGGGKTFLLKLDSCGVRTHALADWRLKPAP